MYLRRMTARRDRFLEIARRLRVGNYEPQAANALVKKGDKGEVDVTDFAPPRKRNLGRILEQEAIGVRPIGEASPSLIPGGPRIKRATFSRYKGGDDPFQSFLASAISEEARAILRNVRLGWIWYWRSEWRKEGRLRK